MNYKKIIGIVCAIFLSMTLCSSCVLGQNEDEIGDVGNLTEQQRGEESSSGNEGISGVEKSVDHGLADGDENIVVYEWSGQLIRVNSDGSDRQVLLEDSVALVCIYDGWIYYKEITDYTDPNEGIYKMRVDGSDKILLSTQVPMSFFVVNGWVYYVVYNADYYMDWERALTIW